MLWIERTPPRVHVQHQGLLAPHEPSDAARFALRRRPRVPPEDALDKRFVYRDKLPERRRRRGVAALPRALMPLHSAGKLGAVLFQFPQWFTISRKNKAYIEECAGTAARTSASPSSSATHSWMSEDNVEETLGFLEALDLPYVCVDMPQGFDSSLPPSPRPRRRIWPWCASTVATRPHGT